MMIGKGAASCHGTNKGHSRYIVAERTIFRLSRNEMVVQASERNGKKKGWKAK
jgi:hypothetical protein